MKISQYLAVVALVMAVLGSSMVSAGTVYRWIDEHGEIIYSDRKPSPEAERVDEGEEWGQAVEQRGQASEEGGPDAESQAEQEARCAEARRMLSEYQGSEFLFRETEDGGEEVLTEDEREAEIQRVQEMVNRACDQENAD